MSIVISQVVAREKTNKQTKMDEQKNVLKA